MRSIVASIAIAERVLLWILGASSPRSLSPARLVNTGLLEMSPETLLAAPITASIVLLGSVLLAVEALRIAMSLRNERQTPDEQPVAVAEDA